MVAVLVTVAIEVVVGPLTVVVVVVVLRVGTVRDGVA